MQIGVLALQGAFLEQEQMLDKLGVAHVELRKAEDLELSFDGLILPGGESTVQGKLLRELGMFEPLKKRIWEGMPVLGTCAGLILLAEKVEQGESHFATLPVTVKRNAYGRQLGSFYTEGAFGELGRVPMTFIRAPYIAEVGKGVEVLAETGGHVVAVRFENQLAMAFHPELNEDLKIHRMFTKMVQEAL